jgi:Flp pilus assembly protein TadG
LLSPANRAASRREQHGAAVLEFHVVALFAMMPMLLGMLQGSLLMIANHQVDFAAFMAARAGATEGGGEGAIRTAFADALAPMFLGAGERNDPDALARRLVQARLRAATALLAHGRIRVLSPTPQAQRELSIGRDGQRVIPNDSLAVRLGQSGGGGLLDGNLLEIEATWCHPLIVPVARPMLIATMRWLDHEPWHQLCYASDRLPIRSRGIAVMQSDFIVDP